MVTVHFERNAKLPACFAANSKCRNVRFCGVQFSLLSSPTTANPSNKPASSRRHPEVAADETAEATSRPDSTLPDDANDIADEIFVDHVLPSSAGGDRLFTVGELTWAIVGSHVATLALCIALAAGICWRTGRNRSDDADTSKDVYAFDTPTVADFDLDRRRQQQRFGGTLGRSETIAVASSILPSAPSKSCVGTVSGTSLFRDRGYPDREEWVRKLLADYRTQQQQQYAPAANGVHPSHHPSVQYQYSSTGTYRATDTITTAVSIKR
jgi:hypothetical protein